MTAELKIVEELGGETIAIYISRQGRSFLQLNEDGSQSWESGANGLVIVPVRRITVAEAEFLLTLLTALFGEKPEPDPRAPDGTLCRRQWRLNLGYFKVIDFWEHST